MGLMKPTSNSFCSSTFTSKVFCGYILWSFCLYGFVPGSSVKWCNTSSRSSPGMSAYDQAKFIGLYLKNSMNVSFSSSLRDLARCIWCICSTSPILTSYVFSTRSVDHSWSMGRSSNLLVLVFSYSSTSVEEDLASPKYVVLSNSIANLTLWSS